MQAIALRSHRMNLNFLHKIQKRASSYFQLKVLCMFDEYSPVFFDELLIQCHLIYASPATFWLIGQPEITWLYTSFIKQYISSRSGSNMNEGVFA